MGTAVIIHAIVIFLLMLLLKFILICPAGFSIFEKKNAMANNDKTRGKQDKLQHIIHTHISINKLAQHYNS